MQRSEINRHIRRALDLCRQYSFSLPPFAAFTPDEWQNKGAEYDEVRDNMLGWDITDYGLGKFNEIGLTLVTIRNGNRNNKRYNKPYAEKILISEENQICPLHFHWFKMEDIINRGGGFLMMQLYNATANDALADTPVQVQQDGRRCSIPAGSILRLAPGESVTLLPHIYHAFWAEKGCGPVLIGEVSQCNDDTVDNHFYESVGRFPTIEEDEAPFRLLCNEYPTAKKSLDSSAAERPTSITKIG